MGEKKWYFSNLHRPEEFIVIHDELSARTLSKLLEKNSSEKWVVKENVSTTTARPLGSNIPSNHFHQKGQDRRKQKRFAAAFRVIVVSGKSSFRTTSVDISAGGMLLKDKLPETFLKQKCIAYISSSDSRENLEMICVIVGDSRDLRRISFQSVEPPSLKRLGDWREEAIAA